MGDWIKSKWTRRGLIGLIVLDILQNISDKIFDWSWDYLLVSTAKGYILIERVASKEDLMDKD